MRIDLVIIDPQDDFLTGSLAIPGASEDMDRLATFIGDVASHLSSVHVTLDQHHALDSSHPYWFADDNGEPAPPITIMTYDESQDVFVGTLLDGSTRTFRARKLGNIPTQMAQAICGRPKMSYQAYTAWYVKQLTASGRYPHCIWPEHCLIGSAGAQVHKGVFDAVGAWAERHVTTVNFVAKGSNPFTEHFSAVKAEVPLPNDPSTQVNTRWVQTLERADLIYLAGEGLSHCVANSGRDTVAEFSDSSFAKKIVLLTECSSNVPGFEKYGDEFITEMAALGMRSMTCAEAVASLR